MVRRIRLALGAGVRGMPGGASLLRLRRRSVAAFRRRMYPIRPPVHSPDHVAALSAVAVDHPFITGNGIAARCRYVINYDELEVNDDVQNDWWFCRSDFVEYFFAEHEPRGDYVLFSHNSDRSIDESLHRFLRHRRLRAWFAANAAIHHPKLHALPLGIANPRWRHGDGAALARIQAQGLEKTVLFDASYDISTAPRVREHCRDQTGIEPSTGRDFEEYLHSLASSYFCIAPRGNGIDTHRVWEALYLRTIPIVTRSVVSDQHAGVPMIVLDDWAAFRRVEFSPDLYERIWNGWSATEIDLDPYLKRVEQALAGQLARTAT